MTVTTVARCTNCTLDLDTLRLEALIQAQAELAWNRASILEDSRAKVARVTARMARCTPCGEAQADADEADEGIAEAAADACTVCGEPAHGGFFDDATMLCVDCTDAARGDDDDDSEREYDDDAVERHIAAFEARDYTY